MKLTVSQQPVAEIEADVLVVSAFPKAELTGAARQVNQNGAWVDSPVSAATVQKLEDIILTRARDLRRASVRG